MPAIPKLLRYLIFALVIVVLLSAASVGIQRQGPEVGVFSNLCGPNRNEACQHPLMNGGFPVGFFYDRPGIPVEDRLGLEDQFRLLPFLGDMVFYFGLLSISWRFGQARRRMRAEARGRLKK